MLTVRLIVQLFVGLLLVGLVVLVLKWALITAAILAVPFGFWWLWDHRRSHGVVRSNHVNGEVFR